MVSIVARRRIALLALLTASTCTSACDEPSLAPAEHRPNVLLVVVDTLRADHLSQYGYELDTSIALGELADQASRFLRAYSVSPRTDPSTASLMTGLAPETHGVKGTGGLLPEELDTLAERLRRGGWETAGFSHNLVVSRRTGFAQGFDRFEDYEGGLRAYPDVSKMVHAATEWLADADGPFFLYLHPMNVHGPYRVPEQHAADLLDRSPCEGFEFGDLLMSKLMNGGRLEMRAQVSADTLTSLREQYDTAIRYTCDQIELVLEELRDRGLYDDTLVIVTSDHGEELFDHGGFGHAYTLYGEMLHVPLFVKLPRQSESRTVGAPVSLLDLYPTILELLGIESPAGLHGRSLAGVLRGETEGDEERVLYFHEDAKRMTGRAVLRGNYKLIGIERDYERRANVWQLFDVERDPRELHDLGASRPEAMDALKVALDALSQRYRSESPGDAENVRDQLDEKVLRSLGYGE